MITLLEQGRYKLIESKGQTKILILDSDREYAWVNAHDIGELLVTTHKTYVPDCILSVGKYRVYAVENEPDLSDQLHLELHVGPRIWQGYLLPTGFPTEKKKKNRIIPTKESITSQLYGKHSLS